MLWRKCLATLLVIVAASPVWGAAEPLGSVTTASSTTVRDTKLSEGSTVFSGDTISVAANGATRIALIGGAQVQVIGNSSVAFRKADNKVQIAVDRGTASFRFSGNNGTTALVADATVRPVNSSDASALIQLLSETHAYVAAEKGALLITTAHDGKTYTINEGEAADLNAVAPPEADPQKNTPPAPAGKGSALMFKPPSKTVVIWTLAIVTAGAVTAGVLLSRKETKLSNTALGNEVSPSKLN